MNVGEAAIRTLEEYGVQHIFGIPGVHTLEFYRGLANSGITVITPRHEQGAGFMADAYARVSGHPGVCVLITGPGVTNAMTPIAQAWHDSVPLLVLASTTVSEDLGRGRGPLHDVPDQTALTETLTASSELVSEPSEITQRLQDAWISLTRGRTRPVQVAIPVDVLERQAGSPNALPPVSPFPPGCDEAALDSAAKVLEDAHSPVILAGGGTVDAGSALTRLAEAADAPVVLTGNAKGVVSPTHPLCVGARLPIQPVLDMVEKADAVVCVGTELSEVDTLYAGRPLNLSGNVVRIDIDPDQMHNCVPTVPLRGDAGGVASQLAARLAYRPGRNRNQNGPDRVDGTDRAATALADLQWTAQTQEHAPWLEALAAAVPAEAIWSLDSTELAYSLHHYIDVAHPRSWLAPYGLGTLGTALPMAVGAKVAAPDRPVVAVAGDGGALFTIAELATAVDVGRQLTVVIWDNRGYGEIRHSMDAAGVPRLGTETTSHDLVTIARGFGCRPCLVTSPSALHEAVATSMDSAEVSVVVVRPNQDPRG